MTSLSWPCFFICSLFVSFTLDAGHCSELLQTPHDQFDERLLIKPLPNGQVLAQFDFTTLLQVDPLHLHWVRHFRLFPSSIARLITENEVQELHFSLTKGFWKADLWGYPIKSRSSGAELNVWFTNWAKNVELNWQKVTSELSGQFCASINFIDKPISVQPKLSFRPRSNTFSSENQTYNSQFSYYATLPTEAICTENLTPWKKLLPCFGRSGLASLLNAIPLLNSNYLSLALDYQPVCGQPYCHSSSVSLRQTLSVVFTPPGFADGKQSWSLIKLFGNSIRSACSLSTYSHVLVDVSANNTDRGRTSSITPLPTFVIPSPIDQEHNHSLLYTDWIQNLKHSYQQYAIYDVNDALRQSDSNKINIANIYSSTIDRSTALADPPLTVSRFLTGFSMQSGGIVTRIRNRLTTPLNVTYLDVIPWYLRIYLHTLRIQSTGSNAFLTAKQMYYQPAKDRLNPHHLELRVELPANSETTISYDFDKSFLKWTEYPPDANHGVYVGPAVISARIPSVSFDLIFDPVPDFGTCSADHGCFVRLHTVPLLIHLPTPDFSMPYNVICLVSTVVSLAFGPIHNLTTKRLSLVQTSKLARPNLFKRLLSIFFRKQSV